MLVKFTFRQTTLTLNRIKNGSIGKYWNECISFEMLKVCSVGYINMFIKLVF